MKRTVTAVIVAALAVPTMVFAAGSNFVTSFKPGKYTGTYTSILPELNGKTATLEVKQEGNNLVGTVTYEGGKEVWTWNDTTLNQQEFDPKTNKPTQAYGATAPKTPTGMEQTYSVNMKDPTKKMCDAGIDCRNTWMLKAAANQITYTTYGVPTEKKNDPTAKPIRKHECVFTAAK